MKNRIIIDGNDFTQFADGLEEIKESVSEKDGATYVSQTSEITLTEAGYKHWKAKILDNTCEAINKEFKVQIFISACKKTYNYILKAQGISFDPVKCTAKLNMNADNPQNEKVEILKRSYFWDLEEGFLDYAKSINRIPKLLYVKELEYITSAILVIFKFLEIVILNLLFGILLTILDFLGFNIKDEVGITAIEDDVRGAGEFSPVFYLKDIFEFWALKAGLTFKSSIFQSDPYEFTAIWNQQLEKGIEYQDANKIFWKENNLPNLNTIELLDAMKGVFNTKIAIVGNDLILERRDKIDAYRKPLFNLEFEIKEGNIGEFEISFDNQPNYARFRGDYAFDSVDTQGNRAMSIMRDWVEWNDLKHKNRKGDLVPDNIFGASRFTSDEFKNKFNGWAWDQGGDHSWNFGDLRLSHALVLTNDTAVNPKLIVIDQNTKRKGPLGEEYSFALKRQLEPGQGGGIFESGPGKHEYNYPMWFGDSSQSEGLYKLFWEIDNPDNNQARITEINSIKWRPANFCQTVDFLKENGLLIKITSQYGDGNIGSYEIDYPNCSINLQDIKFKCDESKN